MTEPQSFHDLVPVKSRDIDGATMPTVNARRLHAALLVGKDFSNWIKGRIDRFGFEEGRDFAVTQDLSSPNLASTKSRLQTLIEYHLTLDMAKEIAMVENNPRGRAVRRYFIECERLVRENGGGGEIDPRVIGGIVKGIVRKSLEEAIRERLPDMLAVAIAQDPRVAVAEYVSVRELLDEAKALPKGRRSLNARIGYALRETCLRDSLGARRCPRTRTWLFPIAPAHEYMRTHGLGMVADHNAKAQGQGVLRFAVHKGGGDDAETTGGLHRG